MILNEPDHKEEEAAEEEDDSEASIDDGVLDELADDKVADEAEPEGFGHISENPADDEKVDDAKEGTELEEDAEDVDFDTFDDIDEM